MNRSVVIQKLETKAKRKIVISDIHGNLDLYLKLLDQISYKPNEDCLILLGDIERKKKILITGIGILLVYLITLLLFNISKNQIQYPDISAEKYVKNILVIIFTGINSIAILPYAAKMYNKIYEGTIEAQELKKKLVFIIILIILGIFLECEYMKDIQQGILNIAKK